MPVCVCVGGRGKIERDREKQETSIGGGFHFATHNMGSEIIFLSLRHCISSDAFHKMLFH